MLLIEKLLATSAASGNSLYAWGANTVGQIGNNTATNWATPQQVGALTTWSTFAINDSSFAIKTDGTLWSWGSPTNGVLGNNTITPSVSSPVQIGALTDWSKIYTGFTTCLAIKTDGTLWAWGDNSYGQLGINTTASRSSPVQIGALTTWSVALEYCRAGS